MFGNKPICSIDLFMSEDNTSRRGITQEIAVSHCLTTTSGSPQLNFDQLSFAFHAVSRLQPGASEHAAHSVALDTLGQVFRNIRKLTYDKTRDNKNYPKGNGLNDDGGNKLAVLRDLTHILISERCKGATDPRDKVYALLGVNGMAGCCQGYPDYGLTYLTKW